MGLQSHLVCPQRNMLLHVDYLKVIISFMWLNVVQATLTSKQCWSAVFPTKLGLARCLQKGHLVTCIRSCLPTVCHKLSSLQLSCLLAIFCTVFFFLTPCPQFRAKYVLFGKYSTEQFSATVPGRGCQQGCHGYLLPCARALPGDHQLCRQQHPSSSIGDEFNGALQE